MSAAKQQVTIENETGLHARPASLLVEEAERYQAQVQVVKDGQEVNAKSIMGVMSLGAEAGAEITIQADGTDAEEAVKSLVKLVRNQFGEGEE
jgi:phosphocarrier protein